MSRKPQNFYSKVDEDFLSENSLQRKKPLRINRPKPTQSQICNKLLELFS